jgi:hypothetical protein
MTRGSKPQVAGAESGLVWVCSVTMSRWSSVVRCGWGATRVTLQGDELNDLMPLAC